MVVGFNDENNMKSFEYSKIFLTGKSKSPAFNGDFIYCSGRCVSLLIFLEGWFFYFLVNIQFYYELSHQEFLIQNMLNQTSRSLEAKGLLRSNLLSALQNYTVISDFGPIGAYPVFEVLILVNFKSNTYKNITFLEMTRRTMPEKGTPMPIITRLVQELKNYFLKFLFKKKSKKFFVIFPERG